MNRCSPLVFAILASLITRAAARPPTTIDEARECTFFVSSYSKDGKTYAAGTAFLAEEAGTQWIYTNAHVIEGASRIEIQDSKRRLVTNFGRFACYSTGSGDIGLTTAEGPKKREAKIRFGGDGVRLELKSKRDIAFEIHDKSAPITKGMKVVTLGDNGGDKILEIMEGAITNTASMVVLTSCKTDHGSSGGPLIDQSTMKVIGLNTWGFSNELKPIDVVWQDANAARKSAGASILPKASWIEIPASEFLKGAEYAKQLLDATRLLTLIYATTPTKSGFRVDYRDFVATGVTYQQAFDQYTWNTMFRPVVDLNRKLGRGEGSNVGINNMEVVNTYAKAIRDIRANYKRFSEDTQKKIPPYYRQDLINRGVYVIGDACHEKLADAEKWFVDKASTGGVMPVGDWIALPPLNSF